MRSEDLVDLTCYNCGKDIQKKWSYVRRRRKELGEDRFHCSRECTDITHSSKMKGELNPNFGGSFHGVHWSTWDEEERKVVAAKVSETLKLKGRWRGENNPKWSGGATTLDCVVCGKNAEYSPYVVKMINDGDRSPTCSHSCSSAYARSHIKSERTSIEIEMEAELVRRGIRFDSQYTIGPFSIDFFLPDYGVAIECDGDYWHRLPEVRERDLRKNAYIKACGYELYRFWEREIHEDVTKCVDKIAG